MDALLSDINQAGLGRGLQFELFRPGQVAVKDYYAELPIAIKVTGRYHDIGSFAADIANLSRIVTLHNLQSSHRAKDRNGVLAMDATARTYRYLDPARSRTCARRRPRRPRPGREEMTAPSQRRAALAVGSTSLLCRCSGRLRGRPGRAAAVDGAAEARGQAERRAALRRRRNSTRSPTAHGAGRAVQHAEADRRPQAGSAAAEFPAGGRDQPPQGAARGLSRWTAWRWSAASSAGGRPYALLQVDNLLYQVKPGDYLGQNYGKITKISETDVAYREIVQDAAGEWIERTAPSSLQEKAR